MYIIFSLSHFICRSPYSKLISNGRYCFEIFIFYSVWANVVRLNETCFTSCRNVSKTCDSITQTFNNIFPYRHCDKSFDDNLNFNFIFFSASISIVASKDTIVSWASHFGVFDSINSWFRLQVNSGSALENVVWKIDKVLKRQRCNLMKLQNKLKNYTHINMYTILDIRYEMEKRCIRFVNRIV